MGEYPNIDNFTVAQLAGRTLRLDGLHDRKDGDRHRLFNVVKSFFLSSRRSSKPPCENLHFCDCMACKDRLSGNAQSHRLFVARWKTTNMKTPPGMDPGYGRARSFEQTPRASRRVYMCHNSVFRTVGVPS